MTNIVCSFRKTLKAVFSAVKLLRQAEYLQYDEDCYGVNGPFH